MENTLLGILVFVAMALTFAEWQHKNPVATWGGFAVIMTALVLSVALQIESIWWNHHARIAVSQVMKAEAWALGLLSLKLIGIMFAYLPVFVWRTNRDFNRSLQPMLDYIRAVTLLRQMQERNWKGSSGSA